MKYDISLSNVNEISLVIKLLPNTYMSSQMRESLVKAITGQTVASQKSAKLISSSLNQVTQVKDEVSLAAQVKRQGIETVVYSPSP